MSTRGLRLYLLPLASSLFVGGCSTPRYLEDFCIVQWPGTPRSFVLSDREKEQKTIANKNWMYAVLSNNVYDDATQHPSIWLDKNEWRQICKNSCNCAADQPGASLQVKKYLRWPKGSAAPSELVFVFAGTNDRQDWIDGNIGEKQYKVADQYVIKGVEDARAIYPDIPILATGHSLGGGLAQHVAFCVKGAKAVVFDSSPRSHKKDCDDYKKADKKNNTSIASVDTEDSAHLIITGIHQHQEILSPLRHLLHPFNLHPSYSDVEYDFATGSLVSRHGMTPLAIGLTRIAACQVSNKPQDGPLPGDANAKEVLSNTGTCQRTL